jgi:hypothetical protein
MKKFIAISVLLLAALLCFSACEKSEPADEEAKETEETTAEETKGEDAQGDDTKVEMPTAGEYSAYIAPATIEGDAKITLNEDKSFSITIEDDNGFDVGGLKVKYLYTGGYTFDNGTVTCTSGKASFTLSSDDANAVLAHLRDQGAPEPAVSIIEDALINGTSLTDDDIGSIPFEKTVFNFSYENGKLIIGSTEEWYGDSQYPHFVCTYENGVLYTKTLYDRTGGVTYTNYYVDGKFDHCVE